MVLRAARGKIAGALFPHDGPPGVERPFGVPQDAGVLPGGVKREKTVGDQVFRNLRLCEQKIGLDVHLRVPEIMPFVPFAGKSLRRNGAVRVFPDGLDQLVQVIVDGAAQLPAPLQADFPRFPEIAQVLLLQPVPFPEGADGGPGQDFQRGAAAVRVADGVAEHGVLRERHLLPRFDFRGELFPRRASPGLPPGGSRLREAVLNGARHKKAGF